MGRKEIPSCAHSSTDRLASGGVRRGASEPLQSSGPYCSVSLIWPQPLAMCGGQALLSCPDLAYGGAPTFLPSPGNQMTIYQDCKNGGLQDVVSFDPLGITATH